MHVSTKTKWCMKYIEEYMECKHVNLIYAYKNGISRKIVIQYYYLGLMHEMNEWKFRIEWVNDIYLYVSMYSKCEIKCNANERMKELF